MQVARDMEWLEKKQDKGRKAIDSINDAKPLPGLDALFVGCCATAGRSAMRSLTHVAGAVGFAVIHVRAAKAPSTARE